MNNERIKTVVLQMPNSFSEYTSDGQNYYFPQCPKTPHFIVFQLWIRFGRVCVSLLLVSVSSSAFPLCSFVKNP